MGRATLLVTFAVILAGCGGAVSTDEPRTVTPAPVPTDGLQYPPGVSEDGVVASQLASAHTRSLATTSYTVTTVQEIRRPDGTVLRRTTQVIHTTANPQRVYGQFDQDDTTFRSGPRTVEIEYWSNDSVLLTRHVSQDPTEEPTIQRWEVDDGVPLIDLADAQHLEGFLAGANVAPSRTTPDGRTVLVGSGIRDPDRLVVPLVVDDPSNLSLQMRVRPDGVVEAMRVRYDGTNVGSPVRIEREMRITDVGPTTVERPPWVANASRQTAPETSRSAPGGGPRDG